jgi:hypothetical protein
MKGDHIKIERRVKKCSEDRKDNAEVLIESEKEPRLYHDWIGKYRILFPSRASFKLFIWFSSVGTLIV